MKKIFTIGVLAVVSGISAFAQEQESIYPVTAKDSVNKVIDMEHLTVMASYAKRKVAEPVGASTIGLKTIQAKLSNQEFPEILKSTPSVYATKMGGGFGDARLSLRGFGSENIGLLINGIPVNGMENGSVYWSNWSGLSEVAYNIQVQRGLGLSKLGLFSAGGTVNIITTGAESQPGGWVYYGMGNDGYQKMGLSLSTGQTKNGWSMSLMGGRTAGNGFVNGTEFEAWNYFVNISKKFNDRHLLSFTAFGAPQWHNRRSNKHYIEDYEKNRDGIKMNTSYGYINGKVVPTYSGYNKYHKPQISLNHYWTISDKSSLSTSAYASMAKGGGRKVYGKDANRLQYNFRDGRPFANTSLTPDGLIDYGPVMNDNAASDHGSDAIFTMGTNSHDWYGFISSFNHDFAKYLSLTAGVDLRYYKGYHYDEITDLLGGKYFKDNTLAWRDPNQELQVGDRVSQDYFSRIVWAGGFAQLAYNHPKYKAFISFAANDHMYKREDPGKYGEFGNQEKYPTSMVKTKWKSFVPISVKAGFNYKFADKHRVFVNGGYVTRAPMLENIYYDNSLSASPITEKIATAEIGYSFSTRSLYVMVNAYYTKWLDKSTAKNIGSWNGPKACIPNLDALHKGFELQVSYSPIRTLQFDGFLSIGDWKWTDDINFTYINEQNVKVGEYNAYIKGLHVGNAPQTSAYLSGSWRIFGGMTVGADMNYYNRFYSDFSPIDRTDPKDRSESWKIPSFTTVDLNLKYEMKVGKTYIEVYGNVNNLFNRHYISDALDGKNHNKASALVWYGFGTTWTAGLKISL